jgi:ABC-2 type transport system ATP-binding protein
VLARYSRLPDREVEAALEQVDLRDRAGDRFRSYSLGMKQRLGVAAALLGEPDLLILDEPTNGLDPAGMADMRALLGRVVERGQTVLLSSHLLGEVQQTCDRVGVISNGRLLTESTVAELRGASSILVRAEPLDDAVRVLERLYGERTAQVRDDGTVRVAVGTEHSPELTRTLVQFGLAVHEVRPVERSLEEVFFEMTNTEMNSAEESNRVEVA